MSGVKPDGRNNGGDFFFKVGFNPSFDFAGPFAPTNKVNLLLGQLRQ